MVENSLSVSVFCICSAIAAVLIRQYSREQSMLTALAATGLLLKRYLIYSKDLAGVASMKEFVNEYTEGVDEFCKSNEVVFSATDDLLKCLRTTIRFIDKTRLGIDTQRTL